MHSHLYLYVKSVGDFTGKYVGVYFNFGQELQSEINGQVGKLILHVLIVDVEKMFHFSLGMKELVGKDADLQLIPLVCKEYVDVCVERNGSA